MKDFPWGILLMSVAVVFFWRTVINDTVTFVITCWVSGAVLGLISGYMKIREDRDEK